MHFHESWGRASRGGWQRGPWGGPGPWGAPFGGRGGGPRVRRGDVRAAILTLLVERPMHGYEMIQELEARTNGVWRPSAGSIYPTLQLLERPPWEEVTDESEGHASSLRDSAFQLGAAIIQVARTGSEDQITKTRDILNDARRRVYAMLGEDGEA
jgi:hypothetical protein